VKLEGNYRWEWGLHHGEAKKIKKPRACSCGYPVPYLHVHASHWALTVEGCVGLGPSEGRWASHPRYEKMNGLNGWCAIHHDMPEHVVQVVSCKQSRLCALLWSWMGAKDVLLRTTEGLLVRPKPSRWWRAWYFESLCIRTCPLQWVGFKVAKHQVVFLGYFYRLVESHGSLTAVTGLSDPVADVREAVGIWAGCLASVSGADCIFQRLVPRWEFGHHQVPPLKMPKVSQSCSINMELSCVGFLQASDMNIMNAFDDFLHPASSFITFGRMLWLDTPKPADFGSGFGRWKRG